MFHTDRVARFTIDELVRSLREAGFHVTYCRHRRPDGALEGLGLFFAGREHGQGLDPCGASEPCERSAPTKRRARERVGESEGRSPSSKNVRLITIGYNIAGTGLMRVMHNLVGRLADRHEIHYLGIGYSGEVVRDRGLTIYPTNPRGGGVFAARSKPRS